MNIDDFPEESDSSDEDYVPGAKPEEQVSEVESDGDPEDPLSDSEDTGKRKGGKGKKRRKQLHPTKKKAKTDNDTNGEGNDLENKEDRKEETEAEKKKRADSLWESFMKDTGFKSKSAKPQNALENNTSAEKKEESVKPPAISSRPQGKVKITKVYQFAGEEVEVEKEVPVDSAEARLAQKPSSSEVQKPVKSGASKGLGGIGSVLSQLGKKPKITTLEKSKLDWDRFKKEENIEDELKAYNKGKDGYLERQDFLERADLRRFEIEKEIRAVERNKRLDNVL